LKLSQKLYRFRSYDRSKFHTIKCPKNWSQEKIWYSTHDWLQDVSQSFRAFLQLFTGALEQNNYSQKYSGQKIHKKKVVSELTICHQKQTKIALKKLLSC
jgi:hypothetical protein